MGNVVRQLLFICIFIYIFFKNHQANFHRGIMVQQKVQKILIILEIKLQVLGTQTAIYLI